MMPPVEGLAPSGWLMLVLFGALCAVVCYFDDRRWL